MRAWYFRGPAPLSRATNGRFAVAIARASQFVRDCNMLIVVEYTSSTPVDLCLK